MQGHETMARKALYFCMRRGTYAGSNTDGKKSSTFWLDDAD
jgi:hypothetical protein